MSIVNVYAEEEYTLTVTASGSGQIKVVYDDEDVYFSENHPKVYY